MRRSLLVVTVAAMLVLAGCAVGTGGGESNVQGDDPANGTADGGTSDEAETGPDESEEGTASGESDEPPEAKSDGGEEGESGSEPIGDPASIGDAIRVAELNVEGVEPDEEHIVLENAGDRPLDLSGWTIRDREGDGQVARGLSPFAFPDGFVLDAGERVTIWTGEGEATDTDLYWGYNVNIWNADGDVVIVQSPAGETVLEHAYGGATADGTNESGGEDGTAEQGNEDRATEVGDDRGTDETGDTSSRDGELEIHHIDVGQADSTLLMTPEGETVLIDTGDWRDDGEAVIEYLEAEGVDRIDHLVATHGHADHVGGHAAVIEHFETERDGIGAAYDSGVPHDTATYERYLDAIEDHDVSLFLVEDGDELPIDDPDVEARVLNPPANDSGDDVAGDDVDANSVALAVSFGEFRYLTTGDADAAAERRMVDDLSDELDADVYQAGHHGSSTSSTESFLDAVDPEIAVISSAYDSRYGHPHDEVLERFAERGVESYWTGVHGDIVLTTDGTGVEVETAEAFSTDAGDLLEAKPDEGDEAPTVTPTTVDRAPTPTAG